LFIGPGKEVAEYLRI